MPADLQTVVANFGVGARAKLANPGASGEPEDQLRAPLDTLLGDLAELCGLRRADVVAVLVGRGSSRLTRNLFSSVGGGSLLRSETEKGLLFQPHMRGGKPGDKHAGKILTHGLPGHSVRTTSVAEDTADCETPTRYAFRSFDRQWIIPDARLINQPNPSLWAAASTSQVFATASMDLSPTSGPAVTFAASVPDVHHYGGRGGRVFPLWADATAQAPNIRRTLLALLTERYGTPVGAEDVVAYIAAVAAHPAFTERFQPDLTTPGIRIPITADAAVFAEAAALGREVIWLHTFGERFTNPAAGRPASPPRIPNSQGPRIPAGGAIPSDPARMPDEIRYDGAMRRLHVGDGYIDNVDPRVWAYELSGKQVVRQWFSYRRKTRDRPVMGDRRPPSKLGEIQPDHWLAEYTSELLNVLHVLGRLVELEPRQANLLDRVCVGPLISVDELRAAGLLDEAATPRRGRPKAESQRSFL